jgi:hypothetical protein
VIVRISGEGQFELPDEDLDRLNQLDNAAVAAVEAGDEGGFREHFEQLIALVMTDGAPLALDDLVESTVIVPPRDISFEEARGEFSGEGLIPD